MLTIVVVELVHDVASAIQWLYLFLGKPVCVALILLQYDSACLLLPVVCLSIPKLDLLQGDLYVAWWGHLLFKHFANGNLNVSRLLAG